MSSWRILRKKHTGEIVLERARWCASFWCHFKGLMFAPPLDDNEGLLFVNKRESRSATTIHMLFMRYSIGVIWLDSNAIVVDKTLARPWRLAYPPAQAAQYFIEAMPNVLDRVDVGDELDFREKTS